MVAVGRIQFSPFIVLIVALNVVARSHVVRRDANVIGWKSTVTNGPPSTAVSGAESSTNFHPKDSTISGAVQGKCLVFN